MKLWFAFCGCFNIAFSTKSNRMFVGMRGNVTDLNELQSLFVQKEFLLVSQNIFGQYFRHPQICILKG